MFYFFNTIRNTLKKQSIFLIFFYLLSTYTLAAKTKFGPEYKKLKFGVLVNNDIYTIYRSSKLGKSGLKKLKKYLDKNDLPFPKNIIYMNKNGYKFPFYFALDEFFLQEAYNFHFFHSFGPSRTYVDGDDPYLAAADIDKKGNLGRTARELFEHYDDGIDGDIENFMNVLNMVLDPTLQPVLFHCHGGRHRTGMIAMVIRYLQDEKWIHGETHRRWGLDLNPAEYEYYKFNRILFRKSNIHFIRKFIKDPRFQELKEKYGRLLINHSKE